MLDLLFWKVTKSLNFLNRKIVKVYFQDVTLMLRKGNVNPFCYIKILSFLDGNIRQ